MAQVIDNAHGQGIADLEVRWESLTDAIEDGKAILANPRCAANRPAGRHLLDGSDSWLDRRTAQWMASCVEQPDADTARNVEEMRQRIADAVPALETARTAPRRTRQRDRDEGSELDYDRYQRGEFDIMWDEMVREERPARIIKVAIEWSMHCMQGREQMMWRGAAAMALVDWLSANGYSVEVQAVWYSTEWGALESTSCGSVVLKPSNAPFDAATLTSALCEIAVARYLGLMAIVAHSRGKVHQGWGMPTALGAAQVQALGLDFVVPKRIESQADAVRWVEAAVAKLQAGQTVQEE